METYNDTLVGNLKKKIDHLTQYSQDLESQSLALINEASSLRSDMNDRAELLRQLLLAAIEDKEDVRSVINSVADLFDISLLKQVDVVISVDVTASVLVPAGFDIKDLDINDVDMTAWNSEVEDFYVDSWDVVRIDES